MSDAMSLATAGEDIREKSKLQKSLRRFDLIFFSICALVGVDTLGAASSYGGQTITWLLVSALTFLVPYGLLISEVGTAFPLEGSVYEWVKMSMGGYLATLTSVVYWISNPVWVGGTLAITAVAAASTFMSPSFTSNGVLKVAFCLLFIWFSILTAIASVRYGKWVPNTCSWVRLAMLAIFGLMTVAYGLSKGFHGIGIADMAPTFPIFTLAIPVLIFNWVGFELGNQASEEMQDPQKDVPRYITISGIVATLAYLVPIGAILLVLPASQLSSVGGFVAAYQTVSGSLLGSAAGPVGVLIGLAVILSLIGSTTTWLMGADRTLAVTGLDYGAPRVLGTFSARFGTPIVVNLLSGVVATVVMAFAFMVTGTLQGYFTVVLNLVISLTTLGYLTIFLSIFILRVKYPEVPRPFRVPGGLLGLGICTALTWVYALVASVFVIWPSSVPTGFTRFSFEATQLGALVAIWILATAFYLIGRAQRPAELAAAAAAARSA